MLRCPLPELDPASVPTPRNRKLTPRDNPGLTNPYIPRLKPLHASDSPRCGGLSSSIPGEIPPELRLPSADDSPRGGTSRHSTPSGTPRAGALKSSQRKRLERLQDSYQTAVSKETLLSEQYEKEICHLSEQLAGRFKQGLGSHNRTVNEDKVFTHERAKLEKRCHGFESRLNALETYNARLAGVIDALRKQNAPRRQAMKRVEELTKKLSTEMAQHKQITTKSLDERERIVEQLNHIREERDQEQIHFVDMIEQMQQRSELLDGENRQAMRTLEKATEEVKQQQYVKMRSHRVKKERIEVRYGYLRNQLEGIDREFRELERIVGVHFVPSQPDSLQEIINKFAEKEARVQSLQKFWAMQNDELAALENSVEIDHVKGDHVTSAQSPFSQSPSPQSPSPQSPQPAVCDEHSGSADEQPDAPGVFDDHKRVVPAEGQRGGHRSPAEILEQGERALDQFNGICKVIDTMYDNASCQGQGDPTLETKACSSSTLDDFLSCLDTRLDEIEIVAAALRDHAIGSQHLSVRKPNEVLERFLCSRSMRPLSSGQHSFETVKKKLPSIADQGTDVDGDGDPQEGSRRRTEKSRGGKEQRDAYAKQEISAWAQRQQENRVASTRPEQRR